MHLFRFSNKKEIQRQNLAILFFGLFGVIMVLNINTGINNSLAFFIIAVLSSGYIYVKQKKYKILIEQLIIEQNEVTLYFFHKLKDSIAVNKKNVLFVVEAGSISVFNKETGKIIGIAQKKYTNRFEDWQNLAEMANELNRQNEK